jgi:hypothetical protein
MSAIVIALADRRPAKSQPPHFAATSVHPELAVMLVALPRAELEFLSAKISDGSTSGRVANARGECDERERRREVWREAESRMRFWYALRGLGHAASYALKSANLAAAKPYADLDKGFELLDRCRAAELELLLTPAPTVATLIEKKRMRASNWHRSTANSHGQAIDAIIARDEAWLKANAPVRRKAVRS